MWTESSNPPSKDKSGRLYFKQFPVNFNSPVVCIFVTKNLIDGPLGLLLAHMNRSFYLCCSKNKKLLHDSSKQRSSMTSLADFLSSLDSFLMFGSISLKSSTKCRKRPAMPLEQITSVRCLFFHSLEAGSGSLNARNSFSSSTALFSLRSLFVNYSESPRSEMLPLSEAPWATVDKFSFFVLSYSLLTD